MMDEKEFIAAADIIYTAVEENIDRLIEQQDAALDYENNSGVLNIDCEDTDSKVIISRQQAVQEIWVAAKSGGFHLSFIDNRWYCRTTDETLSQLLSRVCTEQSSQVIEFANVG